MRAIGMMRCSHCGIPLEIEVLTGVATVICSNCHKHSLVIAIANGSFASARLEQKIMNSSSVAQQTEHIRDQLVWFMKNHPEIQGLETIADLLTRKLTEELKFSSQEEFDRFTRLGPITSFDAANFHALMHTGNPTAKELDCF